MESPRLENLKQQGILISPGYIKTAFHGLPKEPRLMPSPIISGHQKQENMKQVNIWYHKDGDHVTITETPWWILLIETTVGKYTPKFGFDYKIWNWLLNLGFKKVKILIKIPIESACKANLAIYGSNYSCWREECTNHERSDETE